MARASHGKTDGNGTHQQVQDAAGRESGPGKDLEDARIRDILGRVNDLFQFFFDRLSFGQAR
jgi:hypothetical protein